MRTWDGLGPEGRLKQVFESWRPFYICSWILCDVLHALDQQPELSAEAIMIGSLVPPCDLVPYCRDAIGGLSVFGSLAVCLFDMILYLFTSTQKSDYQSHPEVGHTPEPSVPN